MDIRDRVMGDQPNSIFHKIARIVPGYTGYMDRERRRDADKLLRTHLAKEYSAQRDRLNRVQQGLARAHLFDQIGEVDRLAGVFQRFIDRLNTATYGYTGMFDPVKIESEDLDQLYAFDMALADGVQRVSSAIDSIESSVTGGQGQELPSALSRFSALVDELNERLNQRSELLTSGTRIPQSDYQALVGGLQPPSQVFSQQPGGQYPPGVAPTGGYAPSTGGGAAGAGPMMGPQNPIPAAPPAAPGGIPTTDLNFSANAQPTPGISQMSESNEGFGGSQARLDMNPVQPGIPPPAGGPAGTNTESPSSPAQAPGAPGQSLSEGLDAASGLDSIGGSGDVKLPGNNG